VRLISEAAWRMTVASGQRSESSPSPRCGFDPSSTPHGSKASVAANHMRRVSWRAMH
jgi:hypothetical protein